jgi:alpha-glucosidase (family GH31 glycosyl hydrolase)
MLKHVLKAFGAILAIITPVLSWTAGELTVTVTKSPMNIAISAGTKTLAEITAIQFGTANFTSIAAVQETADSIVLSLGTEATMIISKGGTVGSGIRLYGEMAGVQSAKITLKCPGNEHFFGITEQNIGAVKNPDLRGLLVNCWPTAYDKQENWAQAWSPFYYSNLGYAAFWDTFAEGTYSFGVSNSQTVITHQTGTIDFYIIYGPSGDKVHRTYFTIIGAPKNVPIWALGPVIWNDNFSGSAEILSYANKSAQIKTPVSAIWIDRPYSDGEEGWGEMNFKSPSFANPGAWINDSLYVKNNLPVITWACPATWGSPGPSSGFLQESGYYYLDLSNPMSAKWYQDKLTQRQYAFGVRGHKLDRGEESFPVSSPWSDGTPRSERRMKYLYLNAKVTHDGLQAKWGKDQFSFARGAVHRTQQYNSAIWGGDPQQPWSGLIGNLANSIRVNFMGFPMWGSDIGGYWSTSKLAEDMHLRWIGFGVFSGYMEHMYDGKEPWLYGTTFIVNVKAYYDLRMEMLPYVYSLANNSAENGTMMKSLPMVFPDDAATYPISDQYLFGNYMLVAPIVASGTTRNVYLPAGIWYNFWDYADAQISTGKTISATQPVNRIPVYIKANAIYPTGQIYAGNSKRWSANYDAGRNITINAFPGSPGQTETFTYIDYLDNDARKSLTVNAGPGNSVVVTAPAMTIPGKVIVCMPVAPTTVSLNGVALAGAQYAYNSTTKKLEVPFPASSAVNLVINETGTFTQDNVRRYQYSAKLQVQPAKHGVMLVVPAIESLQEGDMLTVTVFDLPGKTVFSRTIGIKSRQSVSMAVSLKPGAYVAVTEVAGLVMGKSKIVIP